MTQGSKNALTGLPGNEEITRRMSKSANKKNDLVVYVDIIDFKPYNEVYGFSAGDTVIITLSKILILFMQKYAPRSFIGHIGGDDFVAVINKKYLQKFYRFLDKEFLRFREGFYSRADLSRGNIVGFNRKGEKDYFPLMGICAVAFSPYARKIYAPDEIAAFATYLKETCRCFRKKDNICVTPKDIEILPVPVENYLLDENIPLYQKRTVIEAMGESSFSHYGRILTKMLSRVEHMLLKKSIIYALGRLRYHPAGKLLSSYAGCSNAHLRTRAVEALGNIGGTSYMKIILQALTDKNPYVASMGAKSIGDIGHPDGIRHLKNLSSSTSKWVLTEAVLSRCRLGDKDVFSELSELAQDKNPLIRKKAVEAMEFIPSVRTLKKMHSLIKKEPYNSIKKKLLDSAYKTANKMNKEEISDSSNILWDFYENSPAHYRASFISVLAKTGKRDILNKLTGYLGSPSEEERFFAVEGLSNYSNKKSVFSLRKSLNDNSFGIRAHSAKMLGKMKDIESMDYLRKSLKDPSDKVRKRASQSILEMAQLTCPQKKN